MPKIHSAPLSEVKRICSSCGRIVTYAEGQHKCPPKPKIKEASERMKRLTGDYD